MAKIVCFFIGFLLCLPSQVQAQEMSGDELHAMVQRMSESLRIARAELHREDSPLELVDTQIAKLRELQNSYKEFTHRFAELSDEDRESAIGAGMLVVELARLDTQLREEILLPHQTELLNAMVFARSLVKFADNPVAAIIRNHSDEFEFDDQQLRKLKKIRQEVAEEVDEIKARYEKEIAEVRSRAKSEIKKTLNKKQLALFERYSAIAEEIAEEKKKESDE